MAAQSWKKCWGLVPVLAAILALSACAPTSPNRVCVTVDTVSVDALNATTPAQQQQGYMGADTPVAGSGIWMPLVEPAKVGVWMKDVQFPLTVAWITDGRIVGVETLDPCTSEPCPVTPAPGVVDAVLEVPATDGARFAVGDPVTVEALRDACRR